MAVTDTWAGGQTYTAADQDLVARAINGSGWLQPCHYATTGVETYTVVSGSVTTITGTTLDGGSPSVGDRILIKDAPAASGTGSVSSFQPGNGVYQVTAVASNMTLARVYEMSSSAPSPYFPGGEVVSVMAGTINAGQTFIVTTPNNPFGGFSYGSSVIHWTPVGYLVGTGLTLTGATLALSSSSLTSLGLAATSLQGAGNVLGLSGSTVQVKTMATGQTIIGNSGTPTIATLSGDVALGSGGVVAITAGAVTTSKMASLIANSVLGNSTGSSASPTAIPLTVSGAANSVVLTDANGNIIANSLIAVVTITTTSGGTTTLTASSDGVQQFVGTATQIVILPDATTLAIGRPFYIANRSSAIVTVETNDGGTLRAMAPGSQCQVILTTNTSVAGTWDVSYTISGLAGTLTGVSVASTNGFSGSSSGGATPILTLTTTVTGLLKGNGTAVSAAISGTDYAPATTGSGILRGNGSGGFSGAVSGTDYAPATTGSSALAANGSGGFTTATLNKVGTPTANFAMGGFTLTGLPTPTTSDQVAIKGYVDTAISGVSVTAGTGLTKTGNTLAVSLTAGTAISISGATIGVSPASIGLAQLSATGITSSTTYHRGDNTWADFATAVGAAVNFTGGTGITISGSTISVTNSSIGPTQLSATGTASAGTFFRGDNTWAPISTLLSSTSLSSLSAPTAAVPWGGKGLTNLANPVNAQDAATKAYVDSATHPACRVATRGSETYTITSNSVTQISGTTIDGVSPSIGDRVLIKDAPATSGSGSILSSQPTNGVYVVTANTTNLTVARATDMSSATPAGAMIIVEAGSINAQTCWLVSSPSSAASFTYGTTAMQWTPFVNVGSGLTRSGNILSLNSTLTGVTMAYGANTITGLPYDLSFVGFGASTSRATGTGDNPMGIRLQRAATLTSVTFRCASADVSGNLVVQLDRNGSAISGTSTTIAAANQVAGVTTTFSHACSAGDIITAQITAIGTTPGSGLVVDITGSY